MDKDSKIIVLGAGVFGLTTARELADSGYRNITVIDRHVPPVPDGSSNDISRVIRFDYGDEVYLKMALDAYRRWSQSPKYRGTFVQTPFILTGDKEESSLSNQYIQKNTTLLTKLGLPWTQLRTAEAAKRLEPLLQGALTGDRFFGYYNHQAGWADAAKAIAQLRDDCIELGVSFISGNAGTVVSLETHLSGRVKAVRTLANTRIEGDHFVLAAGAWTSSLVPMYNSTISTAQVVGYMRMTDSEMTKYAKLPIYINFASGWFNFPPHSDSRMLKMAVHGWGYTRAPNQKERGIWKASNSVPPLQPNRQRPEFVPDDGVARLREGLREILPELADRPFERLVMCWYTDTPTGDFIMDYHPDHDNLFVIGGGSGHAFKFLPVLGEYTTRAMHRKLPSPLAAKWKFRTEYQNQPNIFKGDGSRGGPERREFSSEERAKL